MVKKTLASIPYMEEMIILTLPVFVGQCYLQHGDTVWNGSDRPRYHVYCTLSDVQLKDKTVFVYGGSLLIKVTTPADLEAARVVETHEKEGNDVGCKEGADFPEMGDYFISFEIFEE